MAGWLKTLIAVLLLGAAGAGGYWWWQQQRAPAPAAPVVSAPPPAPLPAREPASEPAVRHPIEAVAAGASQAEGLPELGQSDGTVGDALVAFLGRTDVTRFLQIDRFVRNTVATVDNLARPEASARLWPVVPTAGRMVVTQGADGPVLADANAQRYAPFVRFASAIDAGKAAALYVKLYPLFQSAYAELGFPRQHFNDRLVDVIDLLLLTPEPAAPVRLAVTKVKGPIQPARNPVAYEFADPALEAAPAGQKILVRMGTAQQRALKAKLREFRARITRP